MTRQSLSMTQEELAFGICSVKTLSRIENGKHSVKKKTYQELMEKMNRTSDKIYALCTTNEMELIEERFQLESAINKWNYDEAKKNLNILKNKIGDGKLNEQYLKNTEALIDCKSGKIDSKNLIERLESILKLTVDEYEKYIDTVYPYTQQELEILMRIANAYSRCGDNDKSIAICEMLLRCIALEYIVGPEITNIKIAIMRNYAMILQDIKKYEESIELHKKVLDESVENNYGYMIALALNGIQWAEAKLYEKGDTSVDYEELKRKKRQAYYIAASRNDENIKNNIKKNFEIFFEEEVDDI